MSDHIINVDMRGLWRRALLIVVCFVTLAGVWFTGRWHLGNLMASPEAMPDLEMARGAARFAPDDPQPQFAMAVLSRRSLMPDDFAESVRYHERAVSLSPNNYLLWMSLGQAREQAGDRAGGEQALRRAAELAPAYALPRWHLGNLLLRANRMDEAFTELRRAADANPTLRPQVFNMAWQVYRGDTGRIIATVATSAPARAQLIENLINRNRLDEALRLWSNLSATEKAEQQVVGERLARTLYENKRFHLMMRVQREMGRADAQRAAIGNLLNGGFEEQVATAGNSLFDWQITRTPQAQIHLDPRWRHGGEHSLRIVFNAPTAFELRFASQLILVEPQRRYRLQHYVRTEELLSISTPLTEVLDAATDHILASSTPLPNGTNEWQSVTLEFTTPAGIEAVRVRLGRASCTDAICPIFGKVWYDDFNFERLD